jgi:cytochrome P450
MAACAERAQARWADGQTLDLSEEMMKLTLDAVGRTLFDADVTEDAPAIAAALTDAMEYMMDSVSGVPAPYFWPGPRTRRMKRAVAALDRVVYRIIRARRSERRDRGDVLSILVSAADEHGTLGDLQVRDEVMTLFLAGHETVANALAWAFYLLSSHPELEARLRAEVEGVLGGRTPAYEDLPKLPLALATLKETLRLYPPAYLLGRLAARDIELGPHTVRKGTFIMINIYAMQRRADLFDDPDAFRPERFLGAAEARIPRGAYVPFGAGARVCIGNHFALMEASLMLATLVQRVTFTRTEAGRVEPEPLVTLRPARGLGVRVERRAGVAAASSISAPAPTHAETRP